MSPFSGFNPSSNRATPIPAEFFSELLPQLSDLDELRLCLWVFRFLDLQEGDLRYVTLTDLHDDETFIDSFGHSLQEQNQRIEKALEAATRRGFLLLAGQGEEKLYFINTPRGRAAIESLVQGAWSPNAGTQRKKKTTAQRPNIFALYEQNIGPLTPLLADELRDAEEGYPAEWIGDAFKIAVTRNARNWKYIEAILRSWKEKGRDERDQRSAKENRKLDSEGEYGEYFLH